MAQLKTVHSIILSNAADEKHYAPLVTLASAMTSSPLLKPTEGHVSLLVAALLPAFNNAPTSEMSSESLSTGLCVGTHQLFLHILDMHGSYLFRDVWGASNTDAAGARVGPISRRRKVYMDGAETRCRSFWSDFRNLWSHCETQLGRSTEQLCRNLLMMDVMVRILESDLRLHLGDGFQKSMMFEFLDHANLSTLFQNKTYQILETITAMILGQPELSAPNSLFHQKAREIGTALLNLFVLFCQEAPTTNSERLDFRYFGKELWDCVSGLNPRARLDLYQSMQCSEFKIHMILIDFELAHKSNGEWLTPDSVKDYEYGEMFVTLSWIVENCFEMGVANGKNLNAAVALVGMLQTLVEEACDDGERVPMHAKTAVVEGLRQRLSICGLSDAAFAGMQVWAMT
ncbi:hypothetical protein BJ741DRAFT_604567 [Chytriomyces cf. hyalinus JEL632]|nr:hypothetical protein BJ741DRAFT_604567 [Chytriomyces cf. hyalinus JEL632]